MKQPGKSDKDKKPEPKVDDILIEDNRYTPYGAIPAHHLDHPIEGVPIEAEEE